MEKYDYKSAVKADIEEYIRLNGIAREPDETDDQYEDRLEDELWCVDEVTGNGSLFFDSEVSCEQYITGNLTLFFKAAHEWGLDIPNEHLYTTPASYIDATIRCYYLRECINEIVEGTKHEDEV